MILVKAWVHHQGKIANWGDMLNGELVRLVSGERPVLIPMQHALNNENYLVIGSVLQHADPNSIVWGAGFIGEDNERRDICPKRILAVRGPQTREALEAEGISCPEVYGDPALLLPQYYSPAPATQRHDLGIVPHWADPPLPRSPSIRIIHPWSQAAVAAWGTKAYEAIFRREIYRFIDEICSCNAVASASLHGLICADAYGVPNVQIALNYLPQFKFTDYFRSVGREDEPPVRGLDLDEVRCRIASYRRPDIAPVTARLMSVCPWRERP